MRELFYSMLCVGLLGAAGCKVVEPQAQKPQGHYYLDQERLDSINRVALVELVNHSVRTELSEQLTQALADSFGKKHLFSVYTVKEGDSQWTELNLGQLPDASTEQMDTVGRELNVDAVVIGAINRYQSYPHLLMSLNLKMLDVHSGRVLWAMEQVWDSADRQLELRVKEYYQKEARKAYQPLDWNFILTSPRAFNGFVAFEVAQTLNVVQ